MSEELHQGSGADDKHEAARHMAEAAMRAERDGDTDRADDLINQAQKADPSAIIDVIGESVGDPIPNEADDNEELSVASETVQPGSDAPSRAGISGTGSGADNQGL